MKEAEVKNILVAGEDVLLYKAIEFQLSQASYSVKSVPDLTDLQTVLADSSCTLLLIEINLLSENGAAFLQDLRNSGKIIPVVLIADYGDENLILELLNHGANDFFYLPLNTSELLFRVKKIITRYYA